MIETAITRHARSSTPGGIDATLSTRNFPAWYLGLVFSELEGTTFTTSFGDELVLHFLLSLPIAIALYLPAKVPGVRQELANSSITPCNRTKYGQKFNQGLFNLLYISPPSLEHEAHVHAQENNMACLGIGTDTDAMGFR